MPSSNNAQQGSDESQEQYGLNGAVGSCVNRIPIAERESQRLETLA